MDVFSDFKEGIICKVGTGERIQFWDDVWQGNQAFRQRFPAMYIVSNSKNATVRDMQQHQVQDNGWNLNLRRALFEREQGQFQDLQNALQGVNLQEENDSWRWTETSNGQFT
ncbi:hypothetical protein FRX31_009021, partial [Thalictrum thalictroides]